MGSIGSNIPDMRRIRREPAENLATKELRNAILSGALEPGIRLRQEDLAARLGVSRMPVRQALSVLEREGLVRTDPWRGTIVAPLDRDAIRDSYAFRGIVERYVAETLAGQRSFDTSALRALIVAGRDAASNGDLVRLIDLDLRFHSLLYEAMGNKVLSDVMKGQWAHIRRVMAVTLTVSEYRQRIWDEHAEIVESIDAHDATRAGAAAQAHTDAASVVVLKNIDQFTNRDVAQVDVEVLTAPQQ